MSEPTREQETALERIAADRPLLPFLPLVYVAWADCELSDDEIAEVRAKVEELGGLSESARSRLQAWLDPRSPPTAVELAAIVRTVRSLGGRLSPAARDSLAALGCEMARLSAPPGETKPLPEPVREAVARLELALGVSGGEASRRLLAEPPPAPEAAVEEPPFSAAALGELLDAPYGEIRARVREILCEEGMAIAPDPDPEVYRERVLERCRRLAEAGLGGLGFPEEDGGGGDLGEFIVAFETLAYGDLSLLVKFGVQFGLFGGSIHQLGSERHHRAHLADVASLALPGCFAMSETGHGSNVQDLETVARYLPASREFEIHTPTDAAAKDWIGNAARDGRLATVFAQLEIGGDRLGVHAFLVPIRDEAGRPAPGVQIEDCGVKQGLNGVDNGRLRFSRLRVPREALLDRFARVSREGEYSSPIASPGRRFFTMLGTLVGGRVSVAGAALAAAKTAVTIAVRYGARRRQFGPPGEPEQPLLDYLSHQRRLMPRLAACYALDFAQKHLLERFLARTDEDAREVETLAAGLKSYSSWATIETIQTCREACGGQGFLAANRLPALRADTDVFATFEGDNTVLMQLVAKGRLTEYRHHFADLRFSGLLRHLAARAATALTELNPVVVRSTDEDHLLDPEFHAAAMRYREERMVASAARRLKRRIDEGADPFDAFNQVQDHLLAMARAYVERVVVETFGAAVAALEEGPLRTELARLASLFALWRIEADLAWFLERGYFEAPKSRAIRALVSRLCGEARRCALPLVDAFRIPDKLLGAPIAI